MYKILKEVFLKTSKDLKAIFTNKKFYVAFILTIAFIFVFCSSVALVFILTKKMENRFIGGFLSSLSISAMIVWLIFALINLAEILDKYDKNK